MPGIENFSILSMGGFIFFLLILLIGYILVEIIFGEKYIFRNTFERYGNNLFDRIIHYIFWGIIGNIGYIYLNTYVDQLKHISNIFNLSGELGKSLNFLGEINGIQFVLFSISYFINFLILIGIFKFILNLDKVIEKVKSLFINLKPLIKAKKKKN